MQQVGIFGLGPGAKLSEIITVIVPLCGTVEDLWRFVMRFCKDSRNWPDTIALGGGPGRTEDGWKAYIVERRAATDEERRAHGIPDSANNVIIDGEVVGSVELVRVTSERANLVCQSVGADCQQFIEALEQEIVAQRLNAGDVVRIPATSGEPAWPQAPSREERFTVNTPFEHFANVLRRYTLGKHPMGFSVGKGLVYPQAATWGKRPFIQPPAVVIEGIYSKTGERFHLITFEVVTLSDTRIAVLAKCIWPEVISYFNEVIAEIERCYPEVREQRIADARGKAEKLLKEVERELSEDEAQADSNSTQVVVTDPLVFTGTVERLEELLRSYHRSKHRSPESVHHIVGKSGDLLIRYHAGDGRLITFEAIEPETGKLTIVRRTYPHRWKDYFEELIEAIFRRWLSTYTQYYTCFISYSSKDQAFAERLHNDLQGEGVRCWFAPEDMKIGAKTRPTLDESIRGQDKLLVILSKHAVASQWVEQEVETALDRERTEGRIILLPIRVDNAVMEIESGWPALIRNTRHIGDFCHWENSNAYRKAFERLLRDLKAEEGAEAAA